MKIPYPDNPQHVANLCQLPLLEAQGFVGLDTSLEESIYAYEIAWRDLGDELLFIYRIRDGDDHRPWYERTTFPKDLDVQREFDWVDFNALLGWADSELEVWLEMPLQFKIFDLFNHHGWEEIFGSTYWRGFQIRKPGEYCSYFNRFDVMDAHLVLEWHYNKGGWLQERPSNQLRMESSDVQIHRIGYRNSCGLEWDTLSANAQEIYRELEHRYGFDQWESYRDPEYAND